MPPFALIVLSQLKTMETRSDPKGRKKWKFDLVRRLYQKGYTARKMPYVTSVEKIGIEKGMLQGMLLEAQDMLIEVLTERFGEVNAEMSKQIKRIDSRERLKDLLRQVLRVKNFEEFGGKVISN